jgi:predicted NBD/HSP70 family sugar kinase
MTAASHGRAPDSPAATDAAWAGTARAVFGALLTHGRLTRAAIAELTGFSRVTASGVVDQLIRRGFVEHVGNLPSSTGGPNARAYSLTSDSAYAVGVAVEHFRIAVMTTSIDGTTVSRHEQPLDNDEAVVSAVERAIRAQLHELAAPVSKLRYVVVGTAGVIDPSAGELAFATNRPSWKSNLATQLRAALACPVVFENDVNLAALAEARFGAGQQAGDIDMVLVWLDQGVACGVILGGRLYRGAAGWAGEIAFSQVLADGATDRRPAGEGSAVTTLQDAIGLKGALALARTAGSDVDAVLRFDPGAGSAGAGQRALLAELAHRITVAVAGPVLVFDPDLVVLAGKVVRQGGDALLERVRQGLKAVSPAPARLAMSQTGPDAILSGSMLLALDHARDELFNDPIWSVARRPGLTA